MCEKGNGPGNPRVDCAPARRVVSSKPSPRDDESGRRPPSSPSTPYVTQSGAMSDNTGWTDLDN